MSLGNIKLSVVFMLALSTAVYTDARGEFEPPPEDKTERLGNGASPLYVDMPVEKLYKVYPQTSQKDRV